MYKLPFKIVVFSILFLLFSQLSFSQLTNFTLNVTKTDETCTANGTINFSVTNVTPNATIVYTIYHLPNLTTPISVQNTTSFSGLVAGSYRVVATQSLGSLSNSQQQDVTINNQITLLTYQLVGTNEICGNDGVITVNVTSGNAVSYEIFAGPIIKPLQSSNTFTGLVTGQYQVRVFDACGEGVVQTYTLVANPNGAGLLINITNNINFIDCTTSEILVHIFNAPSQQIKYPLNVTISVQNPNGGSPTVYNLIFNSGSQYLSFQQNVILYANQTYSINIHVIDGCGNNYESSSFLANSNINPNVFSTVVDCNHWNVNVSEAISATLISAPSTFTFGLPYNLPNFNLLNVLPGTYTFLVEDICHGFTNQQITLIPQAGNFSAGSNPGCNVGFGTILLDGSMGLASALVTNAPNSYPYSLPNNISNLINDGYIIQNNFLPGSYTFLLTDTCGNQSIKTLNVVGYQEVTNVVIIPNCGSFDIDLHHSANNQVYNVPTYILQVYNASTNQWVHPLNGNASGIPLVNNAINYNFPYTGTFRILKKFSSVGLCHNSIYEFEYTGQPKINDVHSFLCDNGTYDVFVDAIGLQPLIYRITEKNGEPFVVENGNTSVFLGLPAATYNFQVEDSCGNILNSDFEVPSPFDFSITPQGLCDGQPSSLTVPNFSIFQYQWWKDNDSTTILSTTNSLQFSSFNSVTDAGVYHVRVRYTGNPNSCIDFTLDYNLSSDLFNPNAGLDGSATYCGNQNVIDLFTLLQGSYNSNGIWQELTSSGFLTNNLWNSTTVVPGTYQFKYQVIGLCNSSDESLVNVIIKPIPQSPVATIDPIVCDTQMLNLYATEIPNAIYNWTGPNGFTSTEQNPVINPISSLNNGDYTVKVVENGCESVSSTVSVVVNPLPDFTITDSCLNSAFILTASPLENSFVADSVDYAWSGPNDFSSNQNPIVISGYPSGVYSLTITDEKGCLTTKSIDVLGTLCKISNVITPDGDDFNQSFDLSGLDVLNLQIFSRWGRLVYEKSNYLNEWHGQNNDGGDLPDGTYFYFVQLRSGETKRGWVLVYR